MNDRIQQLATDITSIDVPEGHLIIISYDQEWITTGVISHASLSDLARSMKDLYPNNNFLILPNSVTIEDVIDYKDKILAIQFSDEYYSVEDRNSLIEQIKNSLPEADFIDKTGIESIIEVNE